MHWRKKKPEKLSRAERVMAFIEGYCLTPEGSMVGTPIVLAEFQQKFIREIYDNPNGTRRAVLTLARKNGKTALIAGIMLAHILGPEAQQNSQIVSGAMSREQAALVFSLANKMLMMQPLFDGMYRVIPSSKKIIGLARNVEYKALSADGTTAHGLSPILAILDEVGQVRGPMTPFIEAIVTSQGAHDKPLLMAISTQAPSDADLLSLWIDDAKRSGDPHTVCHVYAADPDCDLLDREQWKKANPALGLFRSEKDLEEQLKQASRIPSMEAGARNLLLNQRISLESLWLAPSVVKSCSGAIDENVFREHSVTIGLDLSLRTDLTAAVMAAQDDDGVVHLKPFVFTPLQGLADRSARDRAPYEQWTRDGFLVAVPGATVDYEWVCEYLKGACDDMGVEISAIEFDRWRIKEMKDAADRVGFASYAEWHEVGQGYKDFSPRIEKFEELMLQGKIRTGSHPLFNMAASNAIAVRDPSGNRKLDKSKSTLRIDPLVASVMAVFAAATADEVGAFIV